MTRSQTRVKRIVLFLAATCFIPILHAQSETGRARIALFEPAGQKSDTALTAVLNTVADSVELSLDVLQRYEVRRLPPADPANDLARVRAYCQANRIDQAILGSGSAKSDGGYLFKLVVYDRRSDSITLAPEGSSAGALDMFDVTDKLVGALLDGLSGTHLLFGALSVETNPAGATVSVNGKEVGTAPLSLRGLPAGAVLVSTRLAGYEDANASVTIPDGESADAPLSLARSTGTLALTVPTDAVVSVSSAEIGQKDIAGPGSTTLPTGDYVVKASSPGMAEVSGKVTVTRGGSTPWLPWPKGYIDVHAVPAGATIVIDGVERGVAPLVVEVDPGRLHHVVLTRDKYQPYATDVSAAAADKIRLAPALVGLPGSLSVATSTPGVNVQLDGGDWVATPFVFENVTAGTHLVTISFIWSGDRMLTAGPPFEVVVPPGERASVMKQMVEGVAHVTIKDAPTGCTIAIDGKDVDSAQAVTNGIDIPAGQVNVSVTGPDAQLWTGQLNLEPGMVVSRSIYDLVWRVPQRSITLDGTIDAWAGLVPMWNSGENFSAFRDQPGTNISDGYVCRDDKFLYIRFDFSDGTPSTNLSKEFKQVLSYSVFIRTDHNRADDIHIRVDFSRKVLGGISISTSFGVTNKVRKSSSDLGAKSVSFHIGQGNLVVKVPLDLIKPYVSGATVIALVVADQDFLANWLRTNTTSTRPITFGF
jgi:hypothetical protein